MIDKHEFTKLWHLTRVQLLGAYGINKARYSGDPKEKKKLIRTALLMAFVGVSLLWSVGFYAYMYMQAFSSIGLPQLMPALMMALASVIVLFTTVFKTNGAVFGFKDYDMTMSLPVKTSAVVASRLVQLYLMGLGFSAMVTLPSAAVYAWFMHPAWWFYPLMVVLSLFVPLAPIVIGTVLGTAVAVASSRFRRTNIVNIFLYIILTVALMAVSMSSTTLMTNPGGVAPQINDAIMGLYPLTRWYVTALCDGNALSLLGFAGVSLALFAAYCLVLGRFFKQLNTAMGAGTTRSNFRMTALKTSKPFAALFSRELRRYFSSSLYVMNTGIGMILLVIASIALLFFKPEQLEAVLEIPGFATVISTIAPMALAVPVCMSCTTCCSISLEGSSLWILKSLPLKAESVLLAKMLVNLTVVVPLSLISAVLLMIAIPMNALQMLLMILTPAVFAVLTAEFGLMVNLWMPNFTWSSEVVVIKQSAPVAIAMLGGMTAAIALTVGLVFLPQEWQLTVLALGTLVVAGIDALLYRYLKTKGAAIFQSL